jgi:chemotaxis protein CheD
MSGFADLQDISALAPLPQLPERQVYLHPGHIFFSSEATLVVTILGPSVSVCLFDVESGTAGVNHYLVPMKLGAESPRYAEVANELLLSKFTDAGIPATALKAKIFGGAMMQSGKSDLAERNVKAARDFLRQNGIPIVTSDVGGERGRKLHFRTTDGAVWIRLL